MLSKKLLAFAMTAVVSHSVLAAWPESPIRVVVPYAAGGSADNALRQMAPVLQARLGQPIVIDNRAGAGGNIGAIEVARSRPDGYTLLLGATNNFVINQFIYPSMGIDPMQAFAPITRVMDIPSLLLTNSTVPAQTFKDFAEYAKAHKGKLNYGSPGLGTSNHLSGYALSESLNADMTHVAYKGAPPAILGLVGNDIQLFIGSYNAIAPQITAGRVKALAVVSQKRLSVLPDVPTAREAGVPDVVLNNWWGLAAPKGTDPAVIQRIADEFRYALAQPSVQQFFESQGLNAAGTTPADFRQQLQAEEKIWQTIVKRSGAKAE